MAMTRSPRAVPKDLPGFARPRSVGVLAALLGCLAASSLLLALPARAEEPASRYSEVDLLRNWALSRCLSKAYGSEATSDAKVAAGAYLEASNAGPQTFESVEAFVDATLAKPYPGSTKSSYNTMKCIDLYNDAALRALIER